VIVIAGAQTRGPELIRSLSERIGEGFPAIDPLHPAGAGHDDEFGAEDLIQIDGPLHTGGGKRGWTVMRGIAADAQVVHQLSDLFGIIFGPLIVGREELHHLVAHFGDCGDGGRQVFGQFATDGIKLQAHRNFLTAGGGESQGRHRAGGDERPSGNAW
jgi:hypothetical protein